MSENQTTIDLSGLALAAILMTFIIAIAVGMMFEEWLTHGAPPLC